MSITQLTFSCHMKPTSFTGRSQGRLKVSRSKVTMESAFARDNKSQRVKGVRIACAGEPGGLSAYDVPLDHDVFIVGEECPVSRLVDMPLLVVRARPTMRYATARKKVRPHHSVDGVVESLMICCDPKLTEFEEGGMELLDTPKRWSGKVGSVIIVRKDCKPLYAHHIEVLLDFIHTVTVHDRFRDSWDYFSTTEGIPDTDEHSDRYPPVHSILVDEFVRSAEHVIAHLTPGDFKDYYMTERRHQKQDTEPPRALLNLPSPWAIGVQDRQSLKRDEIRRSYLNLSLEEKSHMVANWRERILLRRINELEDRLNEAAKIFERLRLRAKARS